MASLPWAAKWIGPAYDPRQDLGVFVFRRKLKLDAVPEQLLIRVSADNRYKLYVNQQLVEFGPQRGDARHWFYEVVDLAPYLKKGENTVWALVWNFGYLAPMAQHTVRTGFVLEGDGLSTPEDWQVAPLEGWGFEMMHSSGMGHFYIDVGPGEVVDGKALPHFNGIGMMESLPWGKPNVIAAAEDRGANGGGTPWFLIPRSIPPMRYDLRESPPMVRKSTDGSAVPLEEWQPIGGGRKIILDFEELICAYPRLKLSGPEGTRVKVTYAEATWRKDGSKGNRDDVVGKEVQGYQDVFIIGREESTFEPLWWRTFRYIEIDADKEAALVEIEAMETGYPLTVESSFTADHPWTTPIWDNGIRTLQRCMGETYFDCPYYEQLQYVGDTRIQALLTYYLTRDRDLPRNAIETMAWSLMENGLTQSRYPSRQAQVIPPFSLWWVVMIRDQVMYDRMSPFDNVQRAKIQAVLNATERLKKTPDEAFWNFGDWVDDWSWGVPPSGISSTMHRLCWFYALAAHMQAFSPGGDATNDAARMMLVRRLNSEFYTRRGFVSHEDDEDWQPSEHAEALFRLCQIALGTDPSPWPTEALEHANAAKCTYYFSFYKHQALQPDNYFELLHPWREMIENGLTTFSEKEEPTRSDCHAWSAHPLLSFFQLVAGVTSAAPGWSKARIQPRPGNLRRFDALVAHPDGELRVGYEDGKLRIETPVPAELLWQGKKDLLQPGAHVIDASASAETATSA
ncbi:MAG TPA: family 78 glycoside hydrolase catalytic domain [Fimbriimonas sp.]|nr:family 78 glycoside hydrolase catalytic domain [Fimbriimonas sp.]